MNDLTLGYIILGFILFVYWTHDSVVMENDEDFQDWLAMITGEDFDRMGYATYELQPDGHLILRNLRANMWAQRHAYDDIRYAHRQLKIYIEQTREEIAPTPTTDLDRAAPRVTRQITDFNAMMRDRLRQLESMHFRGFGEEMIQRSLAEILSDADSIRFTLYDRLDRIQQGIYMRDEWVSILNRERQNLVMSVLQANPRDKAEVIIADIIDTAEKLLEDFMAELAYVTR